MMDQALREFPQQFTFEPVIDQGQSWSPDPGGRFLILGMGGSHLAADLLSLWKPERDVLIHHDYGLPKLSAEQWNGRRVIASSYSGNTEEVLEGAEEAMKRGLPLAAFAVGGKLLDFAKQHRLPFIRLPQTHIQPRVALGFSLRATMALMGDREGLTQSQTLSERLNSEKCEQQGKSLAKSLAGKVPIIYASTTNAALAMNWKIKFNETGKIPAFANTLPELNHNEMTGFDVIDATRSLSERFHFVFLRDPQDHPQIQKRMEVLGRLFSARNFSVTPYDLEGGDIFQKIFSSLLVGDWAAFYLAHQYGCEATEVPMVEEFKRLI